MTISKQNLEDKFNKLSNKINASIKKVIKAKNEKQNLPDISELLAEAKQVIVDYADSKERSYTSIMKLRGQFKQLVSFYDGKINTDAKEYIEVKTQQILNKIANVAKIKDKSKISDEVIEDLLDEREDFVDWNDFFVSIGLINQDVSSALLKQVTRAHSNLAKQILSDDPDSQKIVSEKNIRDNKLKDFINSAKEISKTIEIELKSLIVKIKDSKNIDQLSETIKNKVGELTGAYVSILSNHRVSSNQKLELDRVVKTVINKKQLLVELRDLFVVYDAKDSNNKLSKQDIANKISKIRDLLHENLDNVNINILKDINIVLKAKKKELLNDDKTNDNEFSKLSSRIRTLTKRIIETKHDVTLLSELYEEFGAIMADTHDLISEHSDNSREKGTDDILKLKFECKQLVTVYAKHQPNLKSDIKVYFKQEVTDHLQLMQSEELNEYELYKASFEWKDLLSYADFFIYMGLIDKISVYELLPPVSISKLINYIDDILKNLQSNANLAESSGLKSISALFQNARAIINNQKSDLGETLVKELTSKLNSKKLLAKSMLVKIYKSRAKDIMQNRSSERFLNNMRDFFDTLRVSILGTILSVFNVHLETDKDQTENALNSIIKELESKLENPQKAISSTNESAKLSQSRATFFSHAKVEKLYKDMQNDINDFVVSAPPAQ